jgi:hypothetical protein
MNNIEILKQNLISGLLSIKNQYPDCLWLEECLEINYKENPNNQIKLAPNITNYGITIALN